MLQARIVKVGQLGRFLSLVIEASFIFIYYTIIIAFISIGLNDSQ